MVKKDVDLEIAEKTPLMTDEQPKEPKEVSSPRQKDAASASSPHDMKEAAFWLTMLFVASVTMTVGNKVRPHEKTNTHTHPHQCSPRCSTNECTRLGGIFRRAVFPCQSHFSFPSPLFASSWLVAMFLCLCIYVQCSFLSFSFSM